MAYFPFKFPKGFGGGIATCEFSDFTVVDAFAFLDAACLGVPSDFRFLVVAVSAFFLFSLNHAR